MPIRVFVSLRRMLAGLMYLPTSHLLKDAVNRSFNEGQEVGLEVKGGPKGPQAAEIRPL